MIDAFASSRPAEPLFTRWTEANLTVPPTNNGSENAVRGYRLAAKISGCWRTLATLQRHCRIRSYLTTARSHGRHPLAAIRDALTGNTWMPPHPA